MVLFKMVIIKGAHKSKIAYRSITFFNSLARYKVKGKRMKIEKMKARRARRARRGP